MAIHNELFVRLCIVNSIPSEIPSVAIITACIACSNSLNLSKDNRFLGRYKIRRKTKGNLGSWQGWKIDEKDY